MDALYTFRKGGVDKVNPNLEDFSEQRYSQFKYGNKEVTKFYAHEIVGHLLSKTDEKLVIAATTRRVLPQAASYLADEIAEAMDGVIRVAIKIENPFSGEYGNQSKEEREKIMNDTRLSFDPRLIARQKVVFVEDIVTTGMLSNRVRADLMQAGAREVQLVSIIKIDYQLALEDPKIESRLSNFIIKNDQDLVDVLVSNDYWLMARSCKKLLQIQSDRMVSIIDQLPNDLLLKIYLAVEGEGYKLGELKDGYEVLVKTAVSRGLLK